LSSIEADVYNPPDACNNICPPSPVPPLPGRPTIKVFSPDVSEEFIVNTLLVYITFDDAVAALVVPSDNKTLPTTGLLIVLNPVPEVPDVPD
jgi:hypothetical protein